MGGEHITWIGRDGTLTISPTKTPRCSLPTYYVTYQNAPMFFTDPLLYLPKCHLAFYRPTILPTKMPPCFLPTHYFTDQNAPLLFTDPLFSGQNASLFFTEPLFYLPKCRLVFYRPIICLPKCRLVLYRPSVSEQSNVTRVDQNVINVIQQ